MPDAAIPHPAPTSVRTVLVAEDNETVAQLMSDLLRVWGYEVEVVSHGLAAVQRCAERAYDLVLMDCHMPVMDGWQATRAIRASEGVRRTPILAITGEGDLQSCLEAGMDDYLQKPVRPTLLRTAMMRWLDRGGRRSSPPPVSAMTVPSGT
ncbi:MAG: response regulator [Kofleriaceae bacterium]|nr:response regulator [Myxococcales bacterium]MCB9573308.1 response regulator [Kofleriaceae bacterium]